jgi:hypothetical protein
MSNKSEKIVSNIDINKGSILLLFGEEDAKITRNWQLSRKPAKAIDELEPLSR